MPNEPDLIANAEAGEPLLAKNEKSADIATTKPDEVALKPINAAIVKRNKSKFKQLIENTKYFFKTANFKTVHLR